MMDNTILNVALQTIQRNLHASNSQLQWAVDSYILAYAALMFSAGLLADARGRRITLLIGLVIFTVASALSAYSHSADQLILWRTVMGLGGSVVPGATLALIKNVLPPREHGQAMATWAALGGMSVAFGPILSGLLLDKFWWGSVFLINVPVVIVTAILIMVLVPESRAEKRQVLDIGGVVLSMLGATALIFGIIRGGQTNHWLSLTSTGAIVAGLILIGTLILYERRNSSPAFDLRFFRNSGFSVGTLSISLSFFALTGGTFLLVFYIQLILGYSPLQLGLLLLPVAVGSVGAAMSSTAMVAKRGHRPLIVIGLALLLASLLVLARIGHPVQLWVLEAALFVAGTGMGTVMATTTTLVMSTVEPEKSGAGAAISNTLRQIGAALGVAVMGSIYSVVYSSRLAPVTHQLPLALRVPASGSLSSTVLTLSAAARDPRATPALVQAIPGLLSRADGSFISAMHVTFAVAAIVLAAATVIAWRWLPSVKRAAAIPAEGIIAQTQGRDINA